jgi:hypothetical protein
VTYPIFIFPFGRIKWYHRKVRCPCCKYRESLLRRWIPIGLEYRITPLVGEMLVWLSAVMPDRDVLFHIKQFWGLTISLKGLQGYVHSVGEKIINKTDLISGDMKFSNCNCNKIYIYVDGVMVFLNNCWKEIKVGIIERYKNGKSYYTYYAEKVHWKIFLRHIHDIGNKMNIDTANIKIFISDAGKGIVKNINERFNNYRFLIDYFHATEHISAWLKHLGTKDKLLLADLRKELTSLLYKGKIEELVKRMESLRGKKKKKVLLREEKYFLNHAKNMNYAKFRQHRWHIGSGKIESACRWLIQQRFKWSGMRWKTKGLNLILGLRLALYNERLFPAFNSVMYGSESIM